MDSLRLNHSTIRLAVEDDPNRVISFNPADVGFVERFYGLINRLEEKEKEYQARIQQVDETAKDEHGLPANFGEQLQIIKDICSDLRAEIDEVFGAGTSQAAFGEINTLGMFEEFFMGITPYIQQARGEKLQKHLGKKKGKVMRG